MLIRFAPFLAALPAVASLPAAGQGVGSIPSRMIKAVEFEDRGRVYRVDLESGKVIFSESADIVPIPPAPVPPAPPKPNPPVPTPALTGLALRVNETFRAKVTTNTAETAAALAQAIEVTLAVSGGLQYKGQAILDELAKQVDAAKLRPRLTGFPLGDMLAVVIGDDETKIVSALRDAKAGLEAIQ
jgi:hypothetical protein